MKKRILSLCMAFCMILTLVPAAWANELAEAVPEVSATVLESAPESVKTEQAVELAEIIPEPVKTVPETAEVPKIMETAPDVETVEVMPDVELPNVTVAQEPDTTGAGSTGVQSVDTALTEVNPEKFNASAESEQIPSFEQSVEEKRHIAEIDSDMAVLSAYSTGYPNTHSNTGNQAYDIAQIALTQVGYTETPNNQTKYGAAYDLQDEWCAIFIWWCARQAGISESVIKKTAWAGDKDSFGAPVYSFASTRAKTGDILYFDQNNNNSPDHVGLVYDVDSNYIYTVEGNVGNQVTKCKYSARSGGDAKKRILYIAHPNYTGGDAIGKPTLNVSVSNTTVTFTWGSVTNASSYDLEVYQGSIGDESRPIAAGKQFNVSSGHTLELSSGTYWARVAAVNSGRWNFSDGKAFTVSNTAIPKPVLSVSVNNSTVRFTWSRVTNGNSYDLEVYQGNIGDESRPIAAGKQFNVSSGHTLELSSGTYWARVAAVNSGRWNFSTGVAFTVAVREYTVRYNANNGSNAPSAQKKYHNVDLTLSSQKPTPPSGWSFAGWALTPSADSSYQPGGTYRDNADITLYAHYIPLRTYTIRYNANGGTGAPSDQTKRYDEEIQLSKIEPKRSGYTFTGWATSLNGRREYLAGAYYDENSDLNLYAVWLEKDKYTVSYDANGGSGMPSSQVKYYGESLTLSSTCPTRSGYTFTGWATSKNGEVRYQPGETYTGNSNLTLYAVWTRDSYTVNYDANGGSGTPSSQVKYYGESLTLSSTRPTRSGYTFTGWATSKNGEVRYQPGETYTGNSNLTLYAVWTSASMYYLNLSGYLDRKEQDGLLSYGLVDVYINGSIDQSNGNDTNSYRYRYPAGTKYEIKDIRANDGYTYHGVQSGSLSGTIGTSDANICLRFRKNIDIGSDFYALIMNTRLERYLTNDADSNITSRSASNAVDQVWHFQRQSNGSYKIISAKDGKVMDIANGGKTDGTNVLAFQDQGSVNQQWYIHGSQGLYQFGSKVTECMLDLNGGTSEEGRNINMWSDNNTIAQFFTITKLDSLKVTFDASNGTVPQESINVSYGSSYGNLPVPERMGYTFSGWYTEVIGGNQIVSDTEVITASDHTLYAHWTKTTAERSLTSIEISSQPNKTVYQIGETWDSTGLAVKANYSDGTSETLNNGFFISGFTSASAGTKTVTVTYLSKTAVFTVTVQETVPFTPPADDHAPQIVVENQTVSPGAAFTASVRLQNNPGVASAAFTVLYDSDIFTLENIEKGNVFSHGSFTARTDTDFVQWYYADTDENITLDGVLFTLHFTVNETARDGSYEIGVKFKDNKNSNFTDKDSVPIAVRFQSGTVSVSSGVSGDVTGDGDVTMADVIKLARSVAGYVVLSEPEKRLADVTGDNDVTMADVIKVARYVAGYIVSLQGGKDTALLLNSGENAVIEVASMNFSRGETVQIPVMLTANPGIAGAMFEIVYDETVLKLHEIIRGDVFAGGTFSADTVQKQVQWYDANGNSNTTATGILFTLEFEVINDINSSINVRLKDSKASNLVDIDSNAVSVSLVPGTVSVGNNSADAEITNVVRSLNNIIATIVCTDSNASVFCATYNNDGQMIEIKIQPVNEMADYNFYFENELFDYAKVFILSDSLLPLCQAKRA